MINMLGAWIRQGHKARLLGSIAVVAFAAPVSAQTVTALIAETADAGAEDEIIVTGSRPIRESQEAALETQRESPSLVSVVSADAVGRLPDQNISQAVSRLPGARCSATKAKPAISICAVRRYHE